MVKHVPTLSYGMVDKRIEKKNLPGFWLCDEHRDLVLLTHVLLLLAQCLAQCRHLIFNQQRERCWELATAWNALQILTYLHLIQILCRRKQYYIYATDEETDTKKRSNLPEVSERVAGLHSDSDSMAPRSLLLCHSASLSLINVSWLSGHWIYPGKMIS